MSEPKKDPSLPGEGQPLISVDVVPFFYDFEQQVLQVVVGERIFEPSIGQVALPGVLLAHERVDEAARRALTTKIKVRPAEVAYLGDLGVFDNPDRDPRGPTLSIAKIAVISRNPNQPGVLSVSVAGFAERPGLDRLASSLPFDHDRIVRAAAANALMRIWTDQQFAMALLSDRDGLFTSRDLLTVLRALGTATGDATEPHAANVRRRLEGTGWVHKSDRPARTLGLGRPTLVWEWI